MKALIVEACQTQCLIFANVLSDLNMEVEFSDSAGFDNPDSIGLICISVVLPDIQGYELCGEPVKHPAGALLLSQRQCGPVPESRCHRSIL